MRSIIEHRMRSTVVAAALALLLVAYVKPPRIAEPNGDVEDAGMGPIADTNSPPVSFCSRPAPLYGEFDPHASEFIVVFRRGVDVPREAARLEQSYAFAATNISTVQLHGFSAAFDDKVRDRLRCEPSVDHISYYSRPFFRCGTGLRERRH